MKKTCITLALVLLSGFAGRAEDQGILEDQALAWRWNVAGGHLSATLVNKADGTRLELSGECFELQLGDGRVVKAADFKPEGVPHTETLPAEPASPNVARHFAGRALIREFSDVHDHLTATWQASLRNGTTYVQQELTLRATGGNVWIKAITLFDQPLAEGRTVGVVDGSPVVVGTFFCGCENPMAENRVSADHEVSCRLTRNAELKDGETLSQGFVLGVAEPGQIRRGVLAYINSARAHPTRPFLHYNSWFDIAWDKQKFNETQCLDAIDQFGQQLVRERGVRLDSFLLDDGWDDNKTLWQFHSGFPPGFSPLKAAAAKYDFGIGVWVSPFGGYDLAKQQRLQYASQFGYETNGSGFSLAGPKYYALFHEICLKMIETYGVNQFKFDGLAAGARANEDGLTRDGDAMLKLVADLRTAAPDLYINQTTGTWPSPFWLLDVDSTWRGGADHDFQGTGSWCQQWMTYRDAQTYHNVVKVAPLYPLNSLMLHGIIYAKNAAHLTSMSDADFASQTREFFGTGTQLQELYLTPSGLNRQNWDDLAEAARWARRNADVLADSHWVGGDPGQSEVYGYAAWSPRLGILTLRNPTDKPLAMTTDLATFFELPTNGPAEFQLTSPWKSEANLPPLTLAAHEAHEFNLQPFQVLVREAKATSMGDASGSRGPGAAGPLETTARP